MALAVVLGRPHPDPPLGWPDPRPGVRICPLGPRRAGERRWRRRWGLARSFGRLRCGSLAAALAAGWIPRPGCAASAWLRAGAQDLPVGLQEEDGRIPGARSPTNPSSRDRIRCLHGRIRFSLTGSSCLESGSTTPSLVRRDVHGCAAGAPPSQAARSDGRIDDPAFHRVDDVSMAHGSHNVATAASVGVPGESIVWYILCQHRHHWCRVPHFRGVAEALLLVARDLARPHAARCLRISCRQGCLRRRTKRRRCGRTSSGDFTSSPTR
jgi:hypothetical protein